MLLVTTGRIHIKWSSPKNSQAGQVGVSVNTYSLIFKKIISISMQSCKAFSMREKIISRFFTRPLFTFLLKRLKSTVLREIVECNSRFCRKFSKEIFFYLLHRQAKFCRSPFVFKRRLTKRSRSRRHIDTRSILSTPTSDVHERLKTNCTAIKIAREATNNQYNKYNSMNHLH